MDVFTVTTTHAMRAARDLPDDDCDLPDDDCDLPDDDCDSPVLTDRLYRML